MEFDPLTLPFQHINISWQKDGKLGISLYRKPTTVNTILHVASAHPQSLIRSLPYSPYMCIKRNCSMEEQFENA